MCKGIFESNNSLNHLRSVRERELMEISIYHWYSIDQYCTYMYNSVLREPIIPE